MRPRNNQPPPKRYAQVAEYLPVRGPAAGLTSAGADLAHVLVTANRGPRTGGR